MKTLKVHPETNGGRAVKFVQNLLDENPKENRFLAMTILKGLGLDVSFLSMSNVSFKDTFETKGNLKSPLIVVFVS
jgi:hypothetical protein